MAARAIHPTDVQAGRKAALKCIARRDYCSSELRSKLAQRGFNAETAASVVNALEQEKVLDEHKYIEHFVSYQAGRGKGPDVIARKLRALGLNFELVGQLVEEGQDWVHQAKEVRRKKFGVVLPTSREEIMKQSQFLRYRGFTTAQIRQALEANVEIDVDA